MPGALSDVVVLDLSHALAGPFASTMLGDYGAEIIKIEPLDGEIARAWGPPFYGEESAYFVNLNRNKHRLPRDPTHPQAQAILFRLLDRPPPLPEPPLQLVQHCDRLGDHGVRIGEHRSGGWEIISAPELFIATAAERTRHIRLGTGVNSLAYHHPHILLDRIILLDHLTRGRIMLGIGIQRPDARTGSDGKAAP